MTEDETFLKLKRWPVDEMFSVIMKIPDGMTDIDLGVFLEQYGWNYTSLMDAISNRYE